MHKKPEITMLREHWKTYRNDDGIIVQTNHSENKSKNIYTDDDYEAYDTPCTNVLGAVLRDPEVTMLGSRSKSLYGSK